MKNPMDSLRLELRASRVRVQHFTTEQTVPSNKRLAIIMPNFSTIPILSNTSQLNQAVSFYKRGTIIKAKANQTFQLSNFSKLIVLSSTSSMNQTVPFSPSYKRGITSILKVCIAFKNAGD